MKRLVGLLVGVVLVFGVLSSAYASDWDVAGKVLTGIEGLRIITGGKVDIIGAITGVGRSRENETVVVEHHYYAKDNHRCCEKIWVPHYKTKKEWVPAHTEHDRKRGKVFVKGHYVEYEVECGGHWEYVCDSKHGHQSKNYKRR